VSKSKNRKPSLETGLSTAAVAEVNDAPFNDMPDTDIPAAEPPAPAAEAIPVIYTWTGAGSARIKRGFEAVLQTELAAGPGTVAELTARLLASGEFARVAPQAAELRPEKTVIAVLRQWERAKHVSSSTEAELASSVA
jgi:hypothetical protein